MGSELDERRLLESLSTDAALAHMTEDSDRLVLALEAAGVEIKHLQAALASRLLIGQAQGLLTERLGIDADQAIDYLKRVSMETNRRVIDVAAGIVTMRQLPDGQ